MRIGIDISQTAYQNTGVGNYLSNLVANLISEDKENEYVLFFSSLRKKPSERVLAALIGNPRAILKTFRFPPTVLNVLWNNAHVIPIETFIGHVDVFLSSDWAEPPARRAKKGTIIYDMIVYKYPEETHNETELRVKKMNISANIVAVQRKKLDWVKKESDFVLCISKSTKKDVEEILGIDSKKISVIYPGL